MKPLTYIVVGIGFAQAVQAAPVSLDNRRFDEYLQPTLEHLSTLSSSQLASPTLSSRKRLAITTEQLQQQPELLLHLFGQALQYNDVEAVSRLLPYYQQQPDRDLNLVQWAEAMQAVSRQQLSLGIALYQQLAELHPETAAVRLQLAIALFKQRHYAEAKTLFVQLAAQQLPEPLAQLVADYLAQIAQQDRWQFGISGNYLRESNVNNAPKAGTVIEGFTPTSRPEKAEGFSYALTLNKNHYFANGFFGTFGINGNGKYYWQNRKYNELSLRGRLGLGYRTARTELKFTPFMEQFWYAGGEKATQNPHLRRYSKQAGAELALSYWLAPRWQSLTQFEYGEQRYVDLTRRLSNGNYYALSNNFTYLASNETQWYIAVDYYRKNARWRANAFERYALQLGWTQLWAKGFGSQLNISYAQRRYQMAAAKPEAVFAPSFFKFAQKNHEYGFSLTLWQRDFHWHGITPRITWSYQLTRSNNPFANADRNRVYLSLYKGF